MKMKERFELLWIVGITALVLVTTIMICGQFIFDSRGNPILLFWGSNALSAITPLLLWWIGKNWRNLQRRICRVER